MWWGGQVLKKNVLTLGEKNLNAPVVQWANVNFGQKKLNVWPNMSYVEVQALHWANTYNVYETLQIMTSIGSKYSILPITW